MTSDRPRKLAQTVVSLCVLAALAGVAVGLFIKQSHFSSDRIEYADSPVVSFEPLLPDALMPMSPPERFTPATLWKRIDGEAEFYIDAGLAELSCQRFALVASPADWLELYVYDMSEWANALAVFTPREGSTALELTDRAYESGGSAFFVHGRFYVEVRLSQQSEQLTEAGMALAENFVAETRIVTAGRLDPAELFPPDGLVPDSIKFKKSNVFGFAGLDNVYTASYRRHEPGYPDVNATVYVSPRASGDEAKQLAEAYEQFLRGLGARDTNWEDRGLGGILDMADFYLFDRYYVIMHTGRFMMGVNECDSLRQAQFWAMELQRHLWELDE